jgi:hypothetical protein
MKNLIIILLMGLMLSHCASKKTVAEEIKTGPTVQYRDNFRSVSDKTKKAFLTELDATGKDASVLILTKGFKGESVTISNEKKLLYKGNPITKPESGIGGCIRIDNGVPTKVSDALTKQEALIDTENAKKYKFIYVMKDNAKQGNPYTITYSHKLRPME